MTLRSLDVLLDGEPVGCLRETRRGPEFVYSEDAVERYRGRPLLSVCLPVKARPYAKGKTEAWFAGLLPEGERLERISRQFGVPLGDYIGLLGKIGWECAGAVSLVEEGASFPPDNGVQELDICELAHELHNLPFFAHGDAPIVRVSLGGYQEKMCVVAEAVEIVGGVVCSARFSKPDALTVSTHILKPQLSHRYPHLIEGEAWAMLASSLAARCARVGLLGFDDGLQALMVERFDRVQGSRGLVRVHQEDCCQALGLLGKYADEREDKGSDPTYRGIARLLVQYAIHPEEELAELLRQMTVNVALGNVDAHAKNYAFLYTTRCSPELSPLYDVTPVLDIEPKATHLSMRINGKILASTVCRYDIVDEALSWGLDRTRVTTTIDTVLDDLVGGIAVANAAYPDAGVRHAPHALDRIARLRIACE